MKKVFFIFIVLTQTVFAQSNLQNVLGSIGKHNLDILINKKQVEWKTSLYNTDRFLPNPFIEYDYLPGSPPGAGIQKDFTITQEFDYPSVYSLKKQLYHQHSTLLNVEQQIFFQETMLQAKLLLLEKIWLNKKISFLRNRINQSRDLVEQYEKKMLLGEATILDVNKAKVHLYQISKESALLGVENRALVNQIMEMNGGNNISFNDTIYPHTEVVPRFNVLDSLIEAEDLTNHIYENEINILNNQINLQKALNLPKMQIGYHSQSILNQSYKGIHVGISIPVFENKNKLTAARLNLQYENYRHDKHRLEHKIKNRELYDNLLVQKQIMNDYTKLINSLNTDHLLEKSLRLGEITINEFMKERDAVNALYDDYLMAELEYHKTMARLYKFKLN
jgi:outer membrane protein, heavy metal efflux system